MYSCPVANGQTQTYTPPPTLQKRPCQTAREPMFGTYGGTQQELLNKAIRNGYADHCDRHGMSSQEQGAHACRASLLCWRCFVR